MAIINLKNIEFTDTDNIKLDKVNYNFDQLVSNGGGPQGPTGNVGQTGFQGVNGYQGPFGTTGFQGFQGAQGTSGGDVWIALQGTGTDSSVIFPKHNLISFPNPPIVSVGFKEDDAEYFDVSTYSTFAIAPYQFIINRSSSRSSNLAFKTSGTTNLFLHTISYSDSLAKMTMGFRDLVDPNTRIELWASEFRYVDVSGTALVTVNATNITSDIPAEFNNDLTIHGNLTIETEFATGQPGSPDTNKIAVSADATGKIIFKNIEELGGTAPIGTIISMLPSIFQDNALFLRTETVTSSASSPIEIRVGSGIGLYEGWYLCNGKTWTNGLTGIDEVSHEVPDLNSFSYSIEDDTTTTDPSSQGSVTIANNKTAIIGGSDIDMIAEFQTGVYNISTPSISTSDLNIDTIVGGNTTIVIKRLPQIIYLGIADLYWSDAGTDQTPQATVSYNFDETSNNPATDIHIVSHTATQGSSTSFSTTINPPSGYVYTSVPTFTAPAGFFIASSQLSNGSILLTLNITTQPVDGVTITITYDFTSNITLNTVTHSYLLFALSDSLISDDGSDGTQNTTVIKTQIPGSTSTFQVIVTANSGYEFTQADIDNISLDDSVPARISLSNKILAGDSKSFTATITDSDFPATEGTQTQILWSPSSGATRILKFTLFSESGTSISTGRSYVYLLTGTPVVGSVINMGIYSTTILYTINSSNIDTVGSSYATFLNNVTAAQWKAAGIYSYTQGNPVGFEPTASYDSVNDRLTFNMNWQNSISPPYVQ